MAEYFGMKSSRTCCCLLIIFSALSKLALRFRRCWDAPQCCRLPANAGQDWCVTGADYLDKVRFHYLGAGDLCSCRRLYRSATATTFAHLDAMTVLSRAIVEQGIYPAIDPLNSSSRILEASIVGSEHYRVSQAVRSILQRYKICRIS